MEDEIVLAGVVVACNNDRNEATVCIDGKAHVHSWYMRGGSDSSWSGWTVSPCTCGKGPEATIDGGKAQAARDFLKDGKTRRYESNALDGDGESTGLPKYTENEVEKPLPLEYKKESND